ncbi:MAG TPA: hybrid sensor histidine kinase/response regulator, partial [Pseudomonas sp.]|nr:hybrid sensor histidine kinase/response regulator [Pseudomonas sp.]
MRLKSYLLQINPVLSRPEAARRLLRIFATVLLIGILSGVYTFLLSTFNNDISQRRGYMSSAIAEAHTFFTNREALLESLSLSAVRKQARIYPPSEEEQHLQLGDTPGNQWSIWLTTRMRDYLKAKQVNLLYVNTGPTPQVTRLYDSTAQVLPISKCMLNRLKALQNSDPGTLKELWLSDKTEQHSHLYIFIRLDERDPRSGWLGLEMESREVSQTLSDQSAGEFMMLNSQGMLVFTNSHDSQLSQQRLKPREDNFFGFVGSGFLPDHLVIRKHLKSSDWQLMYSIDLRAVVTGLWKQLLGSLLFCLFSLTLI